MVRKAEGKHLEVLRKIMKIICISDTHAKQIPDDQMPYGDVLVHAGDITNNGKILQLRAMADWLAHLAQAKYEHVVTIGGNHDFILDGFGKEGREAELRAGFFSGRVHYLRDESLWLNIRGRTVKFYGTPWTVCGNWAFSEMDRMKRRAIFDKIPMDTDVLISHGPPYSILDRCDNGAHGFGSVGDLELLGAVERVRPKLHVFGHIHDGYGQTNLYGVNGTTFVNAASTQTKGEYVLGNPPIVIEI
jgi:Icc-related predicted phosphoesterase